jgi:hypothetical protein
MVVISVAFGTYSEPVVNSYVIKKVLHMYKPSTYLLITYFPTYLAISENYFLTELITKAKPNSNSVEVHPQLSNNRHPMDGALVGAGSLWPKKMWNSSHVKGNFFFSNFQCEGHM